MTRATPLGWLGIVRLGLVQTALGAIVVLTTSTLNRVMVVEMALPAPGGLGVREWFLLRLLTPELTPLVGERAEFVAAAVVALLRFLWTLAEVIMAGTTFLAPLVLAAKPQAETAPHPAPLTTDH